MPSARQDTSRDHRSAALTRATAVSWSRKVASGRYLHVRHKRRARNNRAAVGSRHIAARHWPTGELSASASAAGQASGAMLWHAIIRKKCIQVLCYTQHDAHLRRPQAQMARAAARQWLSGAASGRSSSFSCRVSRSCRASAAAAAGSRALLPAAGGTCHLPPQAARSAGSASSPSGAARLSCDSEAMLPVGTN